MKQPIKSLVLAAAFGLWASAATAHHISGKVVCTDTTPPTAISGLTVSAQGPSGTFTSVTGFDGSYFINLNSVTETYIVSITPPAGLTIVSPVGGTHSVTIFANGVGGPDHADNVDFALTGCATPPPLGQIGDTVYCDANGNGTQDAGEAGIPGVKVNLVCKDAAGNVIATAQATTDANGKYLFINVPAGTCEVTVDTSSVTGDCNVAVCATTVTVTLAAGQIYLNADFCFKPPTTPTPSMCWMTAGGVKFEPLASEFLAEANDGGGPNDSFGGNVYPSCSVLPGDGGHWNHVAHRLKLHLSGQRQRVIKCGNVPGTEPGTDSPVCTVNFIHWEGWGTISPVNGGNTDKKVPVYYEGKVEDRAEPGNLKGAKNQPDDVDRYYLKVWYLNADQTIGDPVPGFQFGTYDSPIQVTGGNLQIHCTSCN